MNIQSFQSLARKLEPGVTVLLFLSFLGISVPTSIMPVIKAASYGIVGLLVIGQWKRFLYVFTRDKLLLILIIISVASILWSAAPDYTIDEVKALVRSTIFGAYIATRYTIKEQMKLWAWVFGLTIFLSLIFGIGSINQAWKGIFYYKNDLARIMSLAGMLFLSLALNRGKQRWFALFGFSIATALIFLSQSKSAYVVFAILLLIFPIYKFIMQNYKLKVILFSSLLLIFGTLIVFLFQHLDTFFVEILGKDLTFNGRTTIWELMFDKVRERPWLGFGYSGFWTSEEALYIFKNSWAKGGDDFRFNSHNGFMDVLLQLGALGLTVYIFNTLKTFFRTVYLLNVTLDKTRKIEFFWLFQTLVALFLFHWTDSGSGPGSGTMWSFYVSIALSTAIQAQRIKIESYSNTSYLDRLRHS